MRIDPAVSHLDHNLSPEHVAWIADRFRDHDYPFATTVDLPLDFKPLPSGLHGPVVGDASVPDDEVTMAVRGSRAWPSRLVDRPTRLVRKVKVTVIAGPVGDDERDIVLYTAFGGELAPREPGDPSIADDPHLLEQSRAFWSRHALSR